MSKKMKVCMIIPHFLPHIGGGEQLYYDIAKGLKMRGYEVRVVSSSSSGLVGNAPYDGIDTYYYDWRIFCGHPIVRAKDLKEHIQWADIVHTTMFTTATKTRWLSKKYGKPCVLTIYEVLGNKWFWIEDSKIKALLFDCYERFICMQKFQAYHVISDATGSDFARFCGKREGVRRIYCSIDMPSREEINKEAILIQDYFELGQKERVFLYFGRPAPNKGIFILEQAIEILKKRQAIPDDVKFCWLLAKDPAAGRERLRRRIKEMELSDVVKIKPSVKRNELFKLIISADYVIIPSITEGFGFCAAEACSLGKKVIYSSGGSLPEVVYGKCLEFENRNAENLADKLQMVIEKGDVAFQTIAEKSFEKERMVDDIIQMYCDVCNGWKSKKV